MQNLTPFVGRQEELKWLNQHFEKALDYNGGFVLIKGEIGVGKTRLLSQFTDKIQERNLHILHGKVIRDNVKPFSPFTQMIKHYLCDLDHNRSWLLKFIPPEIVPYFTHLIPELRNHYPLDMPELAHPVDNMSFLYSFQRFFEDLSKSKPLVLILDDIQWMSSESIQLLKYLVKRVSYQPILFITSIRLHEVNPELEECIDEFNTERLILDINLANLSRSETENLVNQKFEINVPNHFVHWLFSITKGNPLFIEEIVKTLVRQNIICHDITGNEWLIEDDYEDFRISDTVENVINYRLGCLAAPELKLLQCAAVIGERYSPEILRELFDSIPENQFVRSSNILLSSGMIEDIDNMRQFAHPLIHTLLYRKIRKNRRRELHRKLAGVLIKINGSDEEIVFHMTKDLLASEETEELACHLFKTSMDLIRSSYNYPNAWEYLNTAQGIAEKISLEYDQKLKIKAELNYLSWIMGRDVPSFKEAERFVTELVDNDLNKEASVTCQILFHCALSAQDLKKAEEYLEKGISLVEKKDEFYWTLMVERCLLDRRKGLLEESEQEAKRLSTEIPRGKAPKALYKVFANLGLVSYLKGEIKQAHQFLTRAQEIVEEHHLLLDAGYSISNLGLIEMSMGKLDSALKKFNDSIKKAELLHHEPLIGINFLYIGSYFQYKGEYEQAIKFFEQTITKAEEINNPRLQLVAQRSKAKAFLSSDDIEKAESILRGISINKIPKQMCCDIHLIRSNIHLKKNELKLAEESVDRSLELAEELQFETRYGIALGTKALILLHKDMQPEALNCLETSRAKLFSKGEMPCMSEILVNFGILMGGAQGEAIFIEGLEMLFHMGAATRIISLSEIVKKNNFSNALEFIHERIDDSSVSQIEIFTFGGLSVRKPGELSVVSRQEWQSRKSQELLALILVQSGSRGATREILASHLWPETTEKKSQTNLRVALTYLKKILGDEVIVQKGPFLTIDRELVWVDFWTFESIVIEWENLKQCGKFHPAEDRARRAITSYKGDFLPEFYSLPLVDKQFELQNRMRELLFWLAKRCMERVEWREAVRFSQKLLILDACNEQACRIIMQGLYNQGDRTGAIRQFDRLSKYLKLELNTTPSLETIKLHETISVTD